MQRAWKNVKKYTYLIVFVLPVSAPPFGRLFRFIVFVAAALGTRAFVFIVFVIAIAGHGSILQKGILRVSLGEDKP